MTDDLRTRIARAIYNACDEYTRKLLVRPDCPGASELDGDGMPVCFMLADDVIRELTTAYVVTSGNYSDYRIVRVYLTREEAERFVELRESTGYEESRIEEFPIGAGCAQYDGPGFVASWSINHDGNTETEHIIGTWLTGDYLRPKERRGIESNYRRWVIVEGINRDHVLKVLRDAATQGRAEREGVSSEITFRKREE